jgi:hypothetical protein
MIAPPLFKPEAYGPVLAPLVAGDRRRALGAGQADAALRQSLAAATLETAFAHASVADPDMARACLAAVWLLHGYLDESHRISQNIDTPTGSFWHGMMHRREGDFSNAKYWFARIGEHPTLPTIGAKIQALAAESKTSGWADRLAPDGRYDPRAMTDACETALHGGADQSHRNFCERAQQAEWESLFDFCYRQAVQA